MIPYTLFNPLVPSKPNYGHYNVGNANKKTSVKDLSSNFEFHNWGFIDAVANNSLRIIIMILCLSIILFSAISGIVIYGFMWKKFKINKNVAVKLNP